VTAQLIAKSSENVGTREPGSLSENLSSRSVRAGGRAYNEGLVMRSACSLFLLLCLAAVGVSAQQSDKQPTLTVRSALVEVPVLLKAKGGEVVFGLTADDFLVTDNGVPQHLTLDQDTDSQPLALVIVVETGGAGARHLTDYRQLDSILDALIGNVEHRIAVIGFDSVPHLLMPFTSRTADASQQLAGLNEGDQGAAIPGRYRIGHRAAAGTAHALSPCDSAAQRNHRSGQ
jgi:hypothetical protein